MGPPKIHFHLEFSKQNNSSKPQIWMDNKPKVYCLNKNCSLFGKDLATGLADVTFIFCPRCTRKLFKEDGGARTNKTKPYQTNHANTNANKNNNNTNDFTRPRSYQNNTNRQQQNIPSIPAFNVTSGSQPDPTVIMLFEKMLNIISTSAKYGS